MKVDLGSRLLLVKNPWCDSLVWTGVGSSTTVKAHTVGSTEGDANMTNTFWMSFEDVMQHFDSLYVNWNPALFSHRQDHHFSWEISDKTTELVFTHNPQYSISSSTRSPVWVVLSRHWQDSELEIQRQRKQTGNEIPPHTNRTLAHVSKQLGFMSLALFTATPPGTRIPLTEGQNCVKQGPYVDSPNTLLRFNPVPNKAYTLVVAQAGMPLPKYSFTLSFFSTSPLAIAPAADTLPHHHDISGSWTRRNAGGSSAHASYLTNPQYAVTTTQLTALTLLLSTDSPDLPVHVALLYSDSPRGGNSRSNGASVPGPSARATNSGVFAGRDVVAASSEYRRGCNAVTVPNLEPGTYTIVASTFEPGQLARFSLRISTAVPVLVRPALPDAAGRLRTPVATPVVFGDGQERLRANMGIVRLTRASITARSIRLTTGSPSNSSNRVDPGLGRGLGRGAGPGLAPMSRVGSAPCAIRVALELGTGARRTVVAVSGDGEFADAALGLRTPEVDLAPETVQARGGLWLVVEQIGSQRWIGQGVQVEVLSDGAVRVGSWEVDDS
jgi:calpain-7